MEKQPYYIQVNHGDIHPDPDRDPWQFRVFANEKELAGLRDVLTDVTIVNEAGAGKRNFLTKLNGEKSRYEGPMVPVYEKIYELGDDEARSHIKKMRNNV